MTQFEINGDPPVFAGQACEGLICEGYLSEGESGASANVTYLRFGSSWHRLYFEHRLIFWRPYPEEPKAWEVPSEGWAYPHVDVAVLAGVRGVRLVQYQMSDTPSGCKVSFRFENGKIVEVEEKNDVASYVVI
jgi:hypothetical protein